MAEKKSVGTALVTTTPEAVAAAGAETVAAVTALPEAAAADESFTGAPEAPAVPDTAKLPPLLAAVAEAAAAVTLPTDLTQKMESAMKTAEEFVSFGQGNVEAFVKASQIWATGVQDLTKAFAATAQEQMDSNMAIFKALAGVKSVKEAIDLQTTLARTSMEKAVTETSKITDASMKLTEQALAPITARVTLAMEKFGRAA